MEKILLRKMANYKINQKSNYANLMTFIFNIKILVISYNVLKFNVDKFVNIVHFK